MRRLVIYLVESRGSSRDWQANMLDDESWPLESELLTGETFGATKAPKVFFLSQKHERSMHHADVTAHRGDRVSG